MGGGRNSRVGLNKVRALGDFLTNLVVLCLLPIQHTPANQLQLGPFSHTIAKTSGRSFECSDRPFLLKENASCFQRNGPYFLGTSFSICMLMATENTQIAPTHSSAN